MNDELEAFVSKRESLRQLLTTNALGRAVYCASRTASFTVVEFLETLTLALGQESEMRLRQVEAFARLVPVHRVPTTFPAPPAPEKSHDDDHRGQAAEETNQVDRPASQADR